MWMVHVRVKKKSWQKGRGKRKKIYVPPLFHLNIFLLVNILFHSFREFLFFSCFLSLFFFLFLVFILGFVRKIKNSRYILSNSISFFRYLFLSSSLFSIPFPNFPFLIIPFFPYTLAKKKYSTLFLF